jgi:hypothetical protein
MAGSNSSRLTPCPRCGKSSNKIYHMQMGAVLFLFVYARADFRYESGCRTCMRRAILRFAFVNLITANIMWPFFILPMSGLYLILSCF